MGLISRFRAWREARRKANAPSYEAVFRLYCAYILDDLSKNIGRDVKYTNTPPSQEGLRDVDPGICAEAHWNAMTWLTKNGLAKGQFMQGESAGETWVFLGVTPLGLRTLGSPMPGEPKKTIGKKIKEILASLAMGRLDDATGKALDLAWEEIIKQP